MTVAEPVIDSLGDPIGVLVGEIEVSLIAADVLPVKYGETGSAVLTGRDGQILASAAGNPVPDLKEWSPDTSPATFRSMAGDVPVNCAAIKVATRPRWVVVSQPRADSELRTASLNQLVMITLVLGLLASTLTGLWFIRSVTGPLNDIVATAEDLASMRLEKRAPEGSISEFRAVAVAVNEMADRLTGLVARVESENEHLERSVARRTEQLQREMQDRLEAERLLRHSHRVESLGRLTAAVGHEINNPLTWVLGNAELLEEMLKADQLTPAEIDTARSLLREIRSGATSINNIVAQIQEFARPEDASEGCVNTTEVLNAAARIVSNQIQHLCCFEVQVPDGLPLLSGSETRLQQVFVNLLSNAGRALDPERPDNRVVLRAGATDQWITIKVSDTGKGLDEEQLRVIFEPFVSLSDAGGMGLGLSVSRAIVESFDGTLEMTSVPGAGTTAVVRLPVREVRVPSVDKVEDSFSDIPSCRILLIDDQEEVLNSFARLLAMHSVTKARSAQEGIARFCEDPYDVVICDLMMPEEDGTIVYTRIHELDPRYAQRIVFATGGVFTDHVRQFVESRGNVCLTKPVSSVQLQAAVAQVVRATRAAQETVPPTASDSPT